MRVLLPVFVLAAAAVAWAAGAHGPASARASTRAIRGTGAMEFPQGPTEARDAEEAPGGDAEATEVPAWREGAVGIVVHPPPADAVDVEVVVVDGESGDVIDSMWTDAERGPEAIVGYHVYAPDGYVAEAESREIKVRVSRRAERLRVVEPLRREADIRVRVVDTAGRPVAGACVVEALRGGGPPGIVAFEAPPPEEELPEPEPEVPEEADDVRTRVPRARSSPSGADGWLRVRGVPHLLDERYWIVLGKGGSEAFVDVLLGSFGDRHSVEATLPVASCRPLTTNSAIGLCGGCGGVYRGGRHRRVAPATLELLVRLRDGRMGAGLEVVVGGRTGVTDGSGRARFEGLRPGTYDVRVDDPDFLWSEAQVDLREGEWRAFVLSEGPGWTARALLLDSMGRPVPYARVGVLSNAPVPYLRVEGGVQDLVFLTDARGEIRLPDLHHAPVSLDFLYGSRSASATLCESDPHATVMLPAP
jgi:hypothetical protein